MGGCRTSRRARTCGSGSDTTRRRGRSFGSGTSASCARITRPGSRSSRRPGAGGSPSSTPRTTWRATAPSRWRRSSIGGCEPAGIALSKGRLAVGVRVMLVRLGHSKDVVAGQMRVFDVAGTKVNVASVDGHLYAFDDTCTHMGCSLGKGTLDDTTVTCSCHGSQFDVTSGAVLRGPANQRVPTRLGQVDGGVV